MLKTNRIDLDKIAKDLADGLRESLTTPFILTLQLLLDGKPVPPEKIADILHIPIEDINDTLHKKSGVEFDNDGNIVGAGITLTPTPFQFQIKGHKLYTWCAFDTLIFPLVLDQTVAVSSTCPITEEKIQFTVRPPGIENLKPKDAVMSLVIPKAIDACCNVRGSFCNHVQFFNSKVTASIWLKDHPEVIIISLNDAYELSTKFVKHLLK